MALPVWGNLEKSQIDNEKIEEAIARLIQAHEDDPDAHIEIGESLQSHKAAEIIDHLVASIIADKIAVRNIPIEKIDYDHFTLQFNWDTIDGWIDDIVGGGLISPYIGSLRMTSGNNLGDYAHLHCEAFSEGDAVNYLKNPRFVTSVILYARTGGFGYFFAGSLDSNGFGFRQAANKLQAVVVLDSVVFAADLVTIPEAWTKYRLEAVYTSGEKIEFYVNGVLEYTKSSDLPEEGVDAEAEIIWFDYEANYNNNYNMTFTVRDLLITQDE